MDLLSQSQLKIINDFRDRVKQSEKRLHDTFDESVHTVGLSTPGLLPYVGTHDEISRMSDLKHSKLDGGSNEIMIQDMSPLDINSPPQKQLQTFIFNGSFLYCLFINFVILASPQNPFDQANVETFDPRNLKTSFAKHASLNKKRQQEDYEEMTPTKPQYISNGKGYKISPEMKNNYIQSPDDSNPEKQSYNYQKQAGFSQNKVDVSQKMNNSQFDLNKYASESRYNNDSSENNSFHKESNYYGNKLEDYLKNQNQNTEKRRYNHEERDENDPQYFYHLEDERRRLKVPSIRYYEDTYVAPLNPSKSMEFKSKSSGLQPKDRSFHREERNVLGVVDRNREREQGLIQSSEQSLKKIMDQGRSFSNLPQDKVDKYQRDLRTEYTRTRETLETTKGPLSPMQNRKQFERLERQKRSGSKERPRSHTPGSPTKKTASVKMRPLSRAPPHKNKSQKGKANTSGVRKSVTHEIEKY